MYHAYVITHIENCAYNVIDDVIMSKNKSNFGTAVTSLIFELERRSKAQKIENLPWLSRLHIELPATLSTKSSLRHQNFVIDGLLISP